MPCIRVPKHRGMSQERCADIRKLFLLSVLVAVVLAIGWTRASAENFGGVSAAYQAKMERYIHVWFDQVGAADRFICVARHESGFNSLAYNDDFVSWGQSVAGLFQIQFPSWAGGGPVWMHQYAGPYSTQWWRFYNRLKDPVQSLRLAWWMYHHAGGLAQWSGTGC